MNPPGTVPRTKLKLKNGSTVYVYGTGDFQAKFGLEIDIQEDAGFYDPKTNLVTFSEPVVLFDGRAAPGVMLK